MTPSVAVEVEAGNRTVRVSSPDRLVFPEACLTKLDLVTYVLAMGERMLAPIRDRPTTMERWMKGVTEDGEAIYQKRTPKGAPDWVQQAEITFPSGRTAMTVAPHDLATLVWMTNLSTLRWHSWPVHADDTDAVDELRLDLDPQPGTDHTDAARAALVLQEVLQELGLTGFPKTSGGRGIHVFVPVEPATFVDVHHAAIAIARELERRMPEDVTAEWWKELRGEKVFVDFNQMARDRLMASAYSIRPIPDARVSAPLAWDEVEGVDPSRFTVATMQQRVEEVDDPWAPMQSTEPGSLTKALELWENDVEQGRGEMPYPPDHPKMPGEPPRVQPSRAKK